MYGKERCKQIEDNVGSNQALNKWLAEMLGKDQATISNGAPTLANQTWKP